MKRTKKQRCIAIGLILIISMMINMVPVSANPPAPELHFFQLTEAVEIPIFFSYENQEVRFSVNDAMSRSSGEIEVSFEFLNRTVVFINIHNRTPHTLVAHFDVRGMIGGTTWSGLPQGSRSLTIHPGLTPAAFGAAEGISQMVATVMFASSSPYIVIVPPVANLHGFNPFF